jgi:acetylornithine deacetylase/succinyl-diaminopimelate desuccinylase-like protein
MKIPALIVFAIASCSVPLLAQSTGGESVAHEWRKAHEAEAIQQFTALLSIPNVASDRKNIQRNADLLVSLLQKRGVESRLLSVQGTNPVVFGEIKTPNAKHTIVFYAHYDGQPVTPSEWRATHHLPQ